METLRFTASISILAFASGTICWFQLGKADRLHRTVVLIGDDGHRRILNSKKIPLGRTPFVWWPILPAVRPGIEKRHGSTYGLDRILFRPENPLVLYIYQRK